MHQDEAHQLVTAPLLAEVRRPERREHFSLEMDEPVGPVESPQVEFDVFGTEALKLHLWQPRRCAPNRSIFCFPDREYLLPSSHDCFGMFELPTILGPRGRFSFPTDHTSPPRVVSALEVLTLEWMEEEAEQLAEMLYVQSLAYYTCVSTLALLLVVFVLPFSFPVLGMGHYECPMSGGCEMKCDTAFCILGSFMSFLLCVVLFILLAYNTTVLAGREKYIQALIFQSFAQDQFESDDSIPSERLPYLPIQVEQTLDTKVPTPDSAIVITEI